MKPEQLISPTLHTAAIAALEFSVNQALKLDPATALKLTSLDNHVFHLHCTSPELSFYLIPGRGEIRLCGFFDGEADTTLTGSANAFAKLATSPDPANALINGELSLHGDSHALIQLQQIGKQLDLDWEAPLAQLFGDVVGHQLGRGLRNGFSFARQAFASFKRQVDDYIVEESDLVAPRWQVERFYSEVDQLSLRAERLEARLQKLNAKRQSKPQSKN